MHSQTPGSDCPRLGAHLVRLAVGSLGRARDQLPRATLQTRTISPRYCIPSSWHGRCFSSPVRGCGNVVFVSSDGVTPQSVSFSASGVPSWRHDDRARLPVGGGVDLV